MKKTLFTLASLLTTGLVLCSLITSCDEKKEESSTTEGAQTVVTHMGGEEYPVILDESVITWLGDKVVISAPHNGTIALKSGSVQIDLNTLNILGGQFIVDMNAINNLDLEGELKEHLEGHLKSADFFDVEKYPEAKFEITKAERIGETNEYTISGNLTLKDITNNIEFKATITQDDTTKKITAASEEIVIDRTKWGVNYGSGSIFKDLKDNIIRDEIVFTVKIVIQP